ncbi:MAG: LptF/LptG family permease, partial [Alphaproteobacteria bacterium]|nr:LptF/LptG family permease [Alphaproteobacteria bacterium]
MNLQSILGRYISKQIVITFLLVLATIMGIIMMFDAIEALRRISGREDVGMSYVVEYVITRLPQTIDKVLPFIMMVAAMITFWKVSKSNEYVIIRSSGVSVWGFLYPVLLSVFIVGVINVALINPISSKMYEMHETIKYRFITRNPNAMLFSSKGLWIREAMGEDKILVLKAKSLRQEDNEVLSMQEVSILEMDRQSQIIKRVEALLGELKENTLKLRGV